MDGEGNSKGGGGRRDCRDSLVIFGKAKEKAKEGEKLFFYPSFP
jgi:hypothetical protein